MHAKTLAALKPTEVYDTYWRFAYERQEILLRRLAGQLSPWTADPILLRHKFTNAYRASDRVSQYLIRHVIPNGDLAPEEVFFRVILFKLFNKIETWEMLKQQLGRLTWQKYSFEKYDAVLTGARGRKTSIYSGAYIMPSGSSAFGSTVKHKNHLRLLERMMEDELPRKISEAVSMSVAYSLLLSYPSIGPFLAYQYVIDLNYSPLTDYSENEFVVAGPGARDGIRKCFEDMCGLTEEDIIRIVCDRQQVEFERLGLRFRTLWGRPLQLIDCQNLFCEVDKYARVAHPSYQGHTKRTRIKQVFRPKQAVTEPWFPPKWQLNELLGKDPKDVRVRLPGANRKLDESW